MISPPCDVSSPDGGRCDGARLHALRHGFHLAVARATGNDFFIRAIEDIRARLSDAISLLPETDAWHSRLSDEHDAILEAIERADEEVRPRAMAHHAASNQGIRAILELIRRREPGRRKGGTR